MLGFVYLPSNFMVMQLDLGEKSGGNYILVPYNGSENEFQSNISTHQSKSVTLKVGNDYFLV